MNQLSIISWILLVISGICFLGFVFSFVRYISFHIGQNIGQKKNNIKEEIILIHTNERISKQKQTTDMQNS